MQDTGFSRYAFYANTEIPWVTSDTERLYKENLKTRRSDLENYGWIDRSFSYKFNEHGFRSDSFTMKDGAMFLGCSLTMGIGIPWESTWPYLVSQRLGLACWNLGQGGGSSDTLFRLAYNWIPRLHPRMVIVMYPAEERFEILEGHTSNVLMPQAPYVTYHNFYKTWITTESNGWLNKTCNSLALQRLCERAKIPLYEFTHLDICRWGTPESGFLDYARDLMHPGTHTVKLFADHVLDAVVNGRSA